MRSSLYSKILRIVRDIHTYESERLDRYGLFLQTFPSSFFEVSNQIHFTRLDESIFVPREKNPENRFDLHGSWSRLFFWPRLVTN